VQSLALEARATIHRALAPCHEYIFQMGSRVVLLYSTTGRVLADGICQLGVFRNHVTLVFPQGIDMQDRAGLLRGSGTVMRHVRLLTSADVTRPEIADYLAQARDLASPRRRSRAGAKVITRVRSPR
jgi:hypothetical protein